MRDSKGMLARAVGATVTWGIVAALEVGCGADVPPTTHADAGRDAGHAPATCNGIATRCELRPAATCEAQDGCYASGECSGISRSCSSYTSSATCYGQLGCSWSSASSFCSGSAWSCTTTSAEENCRRIEGCVWTDGCSGFSSCILQSTEVECLAVDGCRWD